jgi:hypothetical protein
MALNDYAQGMAKQEYGNWLSNLMGLNELGFKGAQGQFGQQAARASVNQWARGGSANSIMDAAKLNALLVQAQLEADTKKEIAKQESQNALIKSIIGALGSFG